MPRAPRDPSDRVPRPDQTSGADWQIESLTVESPGTNARIQLGSSEEVVLWNETSQRYIKDFRLTKTNDLILLGSILGHVIALHRAQQKLSDPKETASATTQIAKAADDIRKAEKALGIDKVSRERGGKESVPDYIALLKRAAYEKGVHLSERVKAYEAVMMEARWKIRILRNGDDEDRAYHRLTEKSVIEWLEKELAKIEEDDKRWAQEKGALFVGKL